MREKSFSIKNIFHLQHRFSIQKRRESFYVFQFKQLDNDEMKNESVRHDNDWDNGDIKILCSSNCMTFIFIFKSDNDDMIKITLYDGDKSHLHSMKTHFFIFNFYMNFWSLQWQWRIHYDKSSIFLEFVLFSISTRW